MKKFNDPIENWLSRVTKSHTTKGERQWVETLGGAVVLGCLIAALYTRLFNG